MGYYFISYTFLRGGSNGSGNCVRKAKRLTATNKDTIEEELAKDFGFDNLVIMYFKKIRRGQK